MEEVWRDIPGWEGLYQVSSAGNVKTLARTKVGKGGGVWQVKEAILTPQKDAYGYYRVCLTKNGKSTYKRVHRLVAEAFIPNPDNLPQINHKDEEKLNNCVENLEWCDAKYNSNYGTRLERVADKKSIWVIKLSTHNEILHFYRSAIDAERDTGIQSSNIIKCCKGKRKTSGGFVWKYSS